MATRLACECLRRKCMRVLWRSTRSMHLSPISSANLMSQFFDVEENWGKLHLRPKYLPGRAWSADELRLKSNSDLHKLWYVLLKERNMLLTMQAAYLAHARAMPNAERLDRVDESMANVEAVVHERNNACLELETGEGADAPQRTVTSFMGFTYKKRATEHLQPPNGDKEYEVPYLDDDAYMMQKLWREKERWKRRNARDDEAREARRDEDDVRHRRSARLLYNCKEHMPPYDFDNVK